MTLEFVAFDREGKEVDWIDPVATAREVRPGIWHVDTGCGVYEVAIPEGGRHEVRERREGVS